VPHHRREGRLINPILHVDRRIRRGRLIRMHESPPIHRRLLRARRERPCNRRTAEQRHELTPFHCSLRPERATGTVAHTSMRQETAALRNFYPAMTAVGLKQTAVT